MTHKERKKEIFTWRISFANASIHWYIFPWKIKTNSSIILL